MIKTYQILNDGAFVVTKINDKLYYGYYHNVYNGDTEERIFEPIAPIGQLAFLTDKELFELFENAE